MANFTCECGRCSGTGRYDRGTCFSCQGVGYKNVSHKPTLPEHKLTVTYENKSVNNVTIYCTTRSKAIEILSRNLLIKGWKADIS